MEPKATLITTCVFKVYRFFLPLYQGRCFFWGAHTGFRQHQPR